MMRIQTIVMVLGTMTTASTLFAATLQVGPPSVVLTAGQTIEIPLTSEAPIAGDLAASGAFAPGDITFTAGPGCRVSARGCTLWISAARTSKRYLGVPVVVTESNAANSAVFALSVIHPGETAPVGIQRPKSVPPSRKRVAKRPPVRATAETRSEVKQQRSGNDLFYAVAEPRPGFDPAKQKASHFTPVINGPSYQIVELRNYDAPQSLSIELTGSGAKSFTISDEASHYGRNQNCATLTRIATGDSCLVIVKGEIGDPRQAPETATLTLRGEDSNVATFTLRDTTFVYAAGGFDTLGNANVSGGNLLAQCTAGACSNALQGTTGNNFSETNFSVGDWINALAVTSNGNLLVGGVFGTIGGASSDAVSGTGALLAQCTPGSVVGDACINRMTTSGANRFAFNNAYIDGITQPQSTNFFYLGGDFSQIRGFTATGGKMLAKCSYTSATPSATCNNFMNAATKVANSAIVAVDFLNSKVVVGGLFTQMALFPDTAPSSGTTFATCTTAACSEGMSNDNPNNSILGITNDGVDHYLGGAFTQIGGFTDSSGGFPLVKCTPGTPTTCINALAASNDANGFIEGLTHSGGKLYVGGRFTTIGGATPVAEGNMLAECTPGGSCENFVTDTNPFATGTDWGGTISAIAVGSQTSIKAN